MTNKAKIWELITDQLSEEEAAEVMKDISNSDELRREFVELQRVWSLTGGEDAFSDSEVEDRLRSIDLRNLDIKREKNGGRFFLSLLKYAAVFAVSFVVSWFLLENVKGSKKDVAENREVSFETLKNQVARATLPDGSVVWLNSNSSISLPDGFSSIEKRNVELRGEALFEVAKDPEKPFIVHTIQGPAVKVLGTKFDIDAYSSDKVITTLYEGSVELRGNNEILAVLKPGEQAVYYPGTGKVEVNRGAYSNVSIWKEDVLTFKDEQLSDIVPKLERFYHVDIIVDKESLNDLHLSGRAFKTYSIEEVLDVFKMVSDIRYKVSVDKKGNKTIHIY